MNEQNAQFTGGLEARVMTLSDAMLMKAYVNSKLPMEMMLRAVNAATHGGRVPLKFCFIPFVHSDDPDIRASHQFSRRLYIYADASDGSQAFTYTSDDCSIPTESQKQVLAIAEQQIKRELNASSDAEFRFPPNQPTVLRSTSNGKAARSYVVLTAPR